MSSVPNDPGPVDPAVPTHPMSPDPGTPQTARKAQLAAVIGLVGTFLVSLSTALAGKGDEDITGREWAIIIIGALVTTAAAYGIVFNFPNTATGPAAPVTRRPGTTR
jgi:hypothetical protein